MPVEVELKLQDLAKIALGVPELTNVNIAVLQSLMEILLKKLNCQNEVVKLGEFETKHLEKILKTSKISPLAFDDGNVENVANKLERLSKLEQEINSLDKKLDNHLKEFKRTSNIEETRLEWEKWESYGMEDLCTICDPDNDIACKLLKNTDFLKKLLRRVSAPMVERIFYFEEKLRVLNEEFLAFVKRAEEEYLKIQLLETCIFEIEHLRKKVNENHTQFICTMEEVQDMLDAKLDKIHMPALKKYIKDHFRSIEESIHKLQTTKECPKAAGIIMDGIRCMSCGGTKVCAEVGVEGTAMLPDVFKKKSTVSHKVCSSCPKDAESTKKRDNILELGKGLTLRRKPVHVQKSYIPKCGTSGDDFETIEGFDGQLYRKG